MSAIANAPIETPEMIRFRNRQRLTIALLLIGYAGYYMCRADFSVSTPLIIKEFKAQGMDKVAIGGIASWGTLAYCIGKFINGSIADYAGGKRMFLVGMGGAVLATLLFGAGGLPFFTLAWVLNRAIQSSGWVGMVKITSRWFSYSAYGAAMGLISLSYLFGEFFSKLFLGKLIEMGLGWRGVFFVSAAFLGIIFVATLFLLKESPRDVGLPEPDANPANLFGEAGNQEKPVGMRDLLLPLFSSPIFWVVCALSFGFTLMRETFGTWTPLYLTEVGKMTEGAAGEASSLFPLFGGISVLVVGFLSDRLGKGGRAALILIGLALSVPALLALGYVHFGNSPAFALIALGTIAFVLIGPYSLLAGAMALDFGGKKGSSTAAGWIDGIGYIGGILSGEGIGTIAQKAGWPAAFGTLAGVSALSCIAAVIYWRQQTRTKL